MGVYNELVFTEAIEQVEAILASSNSDEISTRIEQLASNRDLAMSAMLIFVFKIKKVAEGVTGVELANTRPSVHDLILPPGFKR